MATVKRARTTSSTPRSKKAVVTQAQETTVQPILDNVIEAIRFRAYQLFEQRGRRDGFDIEDWLRAEGEITSRGTAQSA